MLKVLKRQIVGSLKIFQNIKLSEKFKVTAFADSNNPWIAKQYKQYIARKSFLRNVVLMKNT